MKINIRASKTSLTPTIQENVEKKLNILEEFIKPEDTVFVDIEANASHNNEEQYKVEVSIKPSGHYAESSASDMYEALDLLIPKIRQQLTREKDKRVSLRRKLGAMKWKFWKK